MIVSKRGPARHPDLERAILDCVTAARKTTPLLEMAVALEAGDTKSALDLIRWEGLESSLRAALTSHARTIAEQSGIAASRELATRLKLPKTSVQFDVIGEGLVGAVRRMVDSMTRQFISTSVSGSLDAVRLELSAKLAAAGRSRDAQAAARRVVEETGLSPNYVRAVERYREGLRAATMKPERVAALSKRYAARLMRVRARAAAQYLAALARREGKQQAWDQAATRGNLDRRRMRQIWVAMPDACPECEELDGSVVQFGHRFQPPGDYGPPVHPHCRCDVELLIA